MNYNDVFQLAESKGYKIALVEHLITPELTKMSEKTYQDLLYVSLCMVQKWLRDSHKKEIFIKSCGSSTNYIFKVNELGEDVCHVFCSNTLDTYESALLEGINAALQLITTKN